MTPSEKISLKSLEHIARARGRGIVFVGCLLVALWAGGHGALYGAYRVTAAHPAPAPPAATASRS